MPFEIPKSWQWVRIDRVGEIVTGSTPSKSNANFYNGDIPFYKPNDLEQGIRTISSNDHLSSEGLKEARELTAGSVLVTCIGATIGKTGLIHTNGASNQQINAIIPNFAITSEYLYYTVVSEHFQRQIKENASATTLPILNKNDFSSLIIPLAPLDEQNRIVSAISEVFNIVLTLEKASIHLTNAIGIIKSKILELAVTGKLVPQNPDDEPAANLLRRINPKAEIITDNGHYPNLPFNWCLTNIESITSFFDDGDWIEKKDQSTSGIRLIQTGNIGDGIYLDKTSSSKFITEDTFNELSCNEVTEGDLLISRLPAPVGRACIIPSLNTRCITAVDCSILRPNSAVLTKYVLYYTSSPSYRKLVEANLAGTTRQRISRKNLAVIPFPLPPIEEQSRIVAKIEELFSVLDAIKEALQA